MNEHDKIKLFTEISEICKINKNNQNFISGFKIAFQTIENYNPNLFENENMQEFIEVSNYSS